ncbi:MAG: trimethylamine methyltransferase family protein [Anaerolineales bacterium]|nr:MAG: trimethylamine methyltransferase family protein [Anaerolineales bacterium]
METDLRVLSENEVAQVHERTLHVLETLGVRVDTERGRRALKDAGARVDESSRVVHFPRGFVEERLRLAPKKFSLGGRRPGWEFPLNADKCTLLADGAAIFVLDSLTGERRDATRQDWLDSTRLIDALDEVGVYWSMVEPTFAEATLRDFAVYLRGMVTYFSKHLQDSTHTVEQSRLLLEVLGTVFGGREAVRAGNPFSFLLTPISPLVIEAAHTDAYLEIADWGIPAAIMPMPLMGGTAPASLISTLLLANAETLAMLCLIQAAAPGTPVIYAACPAIMDPYTGRFVGSEVEHGLLGAAVTELARSYKLPVEASVGGSGRYRPGLGAGYERALNWSMATLSWPDLLVGPGQLGGSMFLSLEQLLADVEIFRRSLRLSDGIKTSATEWLESELAAVGHGGNFLGRKSTRDAFRHGEVYVDGYDLHSTYEAWHASGKPSLIEELHNDVQEILKNHQPLPLDEDVERELDRIEASVKEK